MTFGSADAILDVFVDPFQFTNIHIDLMADGVDFRNDGLGFTLKRVDMLIDADSRSPYFAEIGSQLGEPGVQGVSHKKAPQVLTGAACRFTATRSDLRPPASRR